MCLYQKCLMKWASYEWERLPVGEKKSTNSNNTPIEVLIITVKKMSAWIVIDVLNCTFSL